MSETDKDSMPQGTYVVRARKLQQDICDLESNTDSYINKSRRVTTTWALHAY